jgi:hypothetical protein
MVIFKLILKFRIICLLLVSCVSFQSQAQTGGLYVGAYHENVVANPEDPTFGVVYLNLPDGEASFKGLMDFTFVGCQSKSVAEIKGDKSKLSLTGEWAGQIDNTVQSGSFKGKYISKGKYYEGTYNVRKGKQQVLVPNCIKYFISPYGTWRIFELNTAYSDSEQIEPISLSNGVASWSAASGSMATSISIIDKDLAVRGSKSAVVYQQIIPPGQMQFRIPENLPASGKTYVFAVVGSDGEKITYISSQEFSSKLVK